jgi:uncharacterized membrane protein
MNLAWLKIRPWLGLASVFLVGALIGSLVTVGVMQKHLRNILRDGPPRRSGEIVVNKLSQELALSEQQKVAILKILKNYEPKFRQINENKNSAIQNTFEQLRQQIRAQLTSEQQLKYDALMKRLRERRDRERKEQPPENRRHREVPPSAP